MADSIMQRMKTNYELPARRFLTRRMPVIVRIDGRAFHTFTKGSRRPFDSKLIDSMLQAALGVAADMQGFKMGYIQSDEASFVMTDYDTLQTDAWFGNCQNKIESIAASVMTAHFARCMRLMSVTKLAYFDARAFSIPESEVANYFLARALDWRRNSVQMYAQSMYPQQELQGKNHAALHDLLFLKGKNWTRDLDSYERNGTFIYKLPHNTDTSLQVNPEILPKYDEIATIWDQVNPSSHSPVATAVPSDLPAGMVAVCWHCDREVEIDRTGWQCSACGQHGAAYNPASSFQEGSETNRPYWLQKELVT